MSISISSLSKKFSDLFLSFINIPDKLLNTMLKLTLFNKNIM